MLHDGGHDPHLERVYALQKRRKEGEEAGFINGDPDRRNFAAFLRQGR